MDARSRGLLGTLIDPGADETDLFLGEGIAFALGRHGFVLDEAGDGVDEVAFLAVPGLHIGAIFAALEGGGEGIEAQFALLLLGSVTLEAAFLEDRLDILIEGQALLVGSWRQFAEIGSGVGDDTEGHGTHQQ